MCCAGNAEELEAKDKRIAELEAILDSLLDGLECSEEWIGIGDGFCYRTGCGWCQVCRAKKALKAKTLTTEDGEL